MTKQERLELEAAAFRNLVSHLRNRKDVQNIDLMTLAGFCRNCLSKWYKAAADDMDIALSMDEAREAVYGMPYAEWKQIRVLHTISGLRDVSRIPVEMAAPFGSSEPIRGHLQFIDNTVNAGSGDLHHPARPHPAKRPRAAGGKDRKTRPCRRALARGQISA